MWLRFFGDRQPNLVGGSEVQTARAGGDGQNNVGLTSHTDAKESEVEG
jgi:hypothetical protein